MAIPYYHVDVFTDKLFAGNPAGVCILSAFLADDVMQKIAIENQHSNTAFVVSRADGDFDLRWFTPKIEDDLCGHATLASAYVLALRGHSAWPVRFHTRSGVLTVTKTDRVRTRAVPDGTESTFSLHPGTSVPGFHLPPHSGLRSDGPTLLPHREPTTDARSESLLVQDKNEDSFEMDFPTRRGQPCETPAGLLAALGLETALVTKSRDYLVVVDHAEQVRTLALDISALAKTDGGIGTIVTAPGDGDVDYVCRFFAPSIGMDEDPATGSIHCTLAPYWAVRLGKNSLRARQLSARGGTMQCTVIADRGRDRVKIAGRARLYLHGTIEL
jgi:predicted PhzF superfamily epimerase YddE/YHI9